MQKNMTAVSDFEMCSKQSNWDSAMTQQMDLAEEFFGPQFRGRRYLRVLELIEIGLVDDRGTLADWVERGLLPPPIYLGRRIPLFSVVEICGSSAPARLNAWLTEIPNAKRRNRNWSRRSHDFKL